VTDLHSRLPYEAKPVPVDHQVSTKRHKWYASGDVNAFFGLMLDNVADLLLAVGLLSLVFGFPTSFALRYMVPGTAVGVLVGDLLFFWMALRLGRRTGRETITSMPLGLDTPSTFGMVFFVLGDAFIHAKQLPQNGGLGLSQMDAAIYTWQIGICSILISGLFKSVCAIGSNWIRGCVPRAGLLGSLAAIALVLITFMPLLEVLHHPVVGFIALAIILTTLVAKIRLPLGIPGTCGALIVAGSVYYLMVWCDMIHHDWSQFSQARSALLPYEWTTVFQFEWVGRLGDSIRYLPIVIPFALATVIGGIDCTESAAAAGDEYNTNQVIGVEAIATLAAALCGGVIQTTPYIGHPAYKAMGGRAAYTLATALFIGSAGLLGYFGFLYAIIPKATVFPILIFIGIEITAQSFQVTPKRHYAAVAFACVPALAALVAIFTSKILAYGGINVASIADDSLRLELQTLRVLSNGFIITSLLWASGLAAIIDRRLSTAAIFFATCAGASLFGIIHSPLPDGRMFLPWQLHDLLRAQSVEEHLSQVPIEYAAAYLAVAIMLLALGWWLDIASPKTSTPKEKTNAI